MRFSNAHMRDTYRVHALHPDMARCEDVMEKLSDELTYEKGHTMIQNVTFMNDDLGLRLAGQL